MVVGIKQTTRPGKSILKFGDLNLCFLKSLSKEYKKHHNIRDLNSHRDVAKTSIGTKVAATKFTVTT